MKKKQIKRIYLQKTRVSKLAQSASVGGFNFTVGIDGVCFTQNLRICAPTRERTICFTACMGGDYCNVNTI